MIYFYSDGSGKLKPLQCRLSNILLESTVRKNARSILFFCLFVCLRSATAFFPWGQLPREDLQSSPLPPRPLVTPGPCLTFSALSPRTFVMHPASGPHIVPIILNLILLTHSHPSFMMCLGKRGSIFCTLMPEVFFLKLIR